MNAIDTGAEVTSDHSLLGAEGASDAITSDEAVAMATDDFEHRRVFAAVKQRIFGLGDLLTIGHFRVTRRLGAGGMGEVYLCDDDRLGRQVAVKRVLGHGSEGDQERLRREAQSLARLSHANVVQVYEVGEHEGRTFVAMQYVEGQTLRAWLEGAPPWREVLERFLAAGRGLAAAHEVGLVHRDFKPDNILIGNDDTVRVADFGLASGVDVLADPQAGTIPYMSLEQLRGEAIDARSDQFSFCVALYEGLWGEQPFTGHTVRDRLAALEVGQAKLPRRHRALFRVVRRGLVSDPNRRWPDMSALLDALEAVPRRRRLSAVVGATLAPLGALLGLVAHFATPAPAICEASLVGVWDLRARAGLELSISRLDAGHVTQSRRRVIAALDDWAGAWTSESEATCELLESERDAQRLVEVEAQHICLTRMSRRVASLVDGIQTGDADTLAAAVFAVSQLPAPAACADALRMGAVTPPPAAISEAVEFLRVRLDETSELRLLGRAQAALELAAATEAAATRLGYPPLIAQARAELAMVEDTHGSPIRAAALYDAAIRLAEIEHLDRLVAELLIERTELAVHEMREYETVPVRLERAEAACERVGLTNTSEARLAFIRGRLAERTSDYQSASTHYGKAIAIAGEDAIERPAYLDALAGVTEDPDQALDYRLLALTLSVERFGDRHPRTAKQLYNYGSALQDAGLGGDREKRLAAEIWDGSGLRWQAKAELLLAAQAVQRSTLDLAEQHARQAQRILDETLLPEDPDRGEPEQLLARIEALRADTLGPDHAPERRRNAIDHARLALRHFELETGGGRADPRVTSLYLLVGNQLSALERFDEADVAFDRVLDDADRPKTIAVVHLQKAEIAFRRANLDQADVHLRKAAPHIGARDDDRPSYELLRALVDLRLDRLTLAQQENINLRRSEYASLEPAYLAWLVALGATDGERRILGFGPVPATD